MKSTKQVRAFIRSMISGNYAPTLYTNKVKDLTTRHVKIYIDDLTIKQTELLANFAGRKNIRITQGSQEYYRPGGPAMIIKCAYKK